MAKRTGKTGRFPDAPSGSSYLLYVVILPEASPASQAGHVPCPEKLTPPKGACQPPRRLTPIRSGT